MIRYIGNLKTVETKKNNIRQTIKNRINRIVGSNRIEDQARENKSRLTITKNHHFTLSPTKKNSKMDQSLSPRQLMLVKKHGIISDY